MPKLTLQAQGWVAVKESQALWSHFGNLMQMREIVLYSPYYTARECKAAFKLVLWIVICLESWHHHAVLIMTLSATLKIPWASQIFQWCYKARHEVFLLAVSQSSGLSHWWRRLLVCADCAENLGKCMTLLVLFTCLFLSPACHISLSKKL